MKIGGININLPGINPEIFSNKLMLAKAKRGVKEHLWPLFEAIGETNFRLAIQQGKPFLESLDPSKLPADMQEYISQAPVYKPLFALFSDEDVLSLLPPWLIKLINSSEAGQKWWAGELGFMKAIIGRT
jgi:hypothetical protein